MFFYFELANRVRCPAATDITPLVKSTTLEKLFSLLHFLTKLPYCLIFPLLQLTASLFVRVVAAIVFVVTLLCRVQAPLAVRAPELIQVASHAGAALLVLAAATIHVAVTLFLLWHANVGSATATGSCWSPFRRWTAPDIVPLALSICCRIAKGVNLMDEG